MRSAVKSTAREVAAVPNVVEERKTGFLGKNIRQNLTLRHVRDLLRCLLRALRAVTCKDTGKVQRLNWRACCTPSYI